LDVNGNVRSVSYNAAINVETLTANKTLTAGTDQQYQWLDPNGASRTITLDTASASAGDRFVIRNNGAYSISYYLTISDGTNTLDYIYARAVRTYVFDGTNWVAGDVGTGISGDYDVGIGYYTRNYNHGTAVGN